jgi:hypothetical protein
MTKIGEYENLYDLYDLLNARTATDFVLASLSPEMEHKVKKALVTSPDTSFLLTWMTLIEKICVLSCDRFDMI